MSVNTLPPLYISNLERGGRPMESHHQCRWKNASYSTVSAPIGGGMVRIPSNFKSRCSVSGPFWPQVGALFRTFSMYTKLPTVQLFVSRVPTLAGTVLSKWRLYWYRGIQIYWRAASKALMIDNASILHINLGTTNLEMWSNRRRWNCYRVEYCSGKDWVATEHVV